MQISAVSQAAHAAAGVAAASAARVHVASRVSPSEVSAAVLQRATADGDGRTGAAALNDGDAAAHAAAQQVASSHVVDVKA